jgi:hypothetical protein
MPKFTSLSSFFLSGWGSAVDVFAVSNVLLLHVSPRSLDKHFNVYIAQDQTIIEILERTTLGRSAQRVGWGLSGWLHSPAPFGVVRPLRRE